MSPLLANFPRFDRNLNTGGNSYDETTWVVAQNVIHHSAQYPSHVLLPVVPENTGARIDRSAASPQ